MVRTGGRCLRVGSKTGSGDCAVKRTGFIRRLNGFSKLCRNGFLYDRESVERNTGIGASGQKHTQSAAKQQGSVEKTGHEASENTDHSGLVLIWETLQSITKINRNTIT